MSNPVIPASASRPVNRFLRDFFNCYLPLVILGSRSLWISSSNCRKPGEGMMQLWFSSMCSPKWSTLPPPRPPHRHQTPPVSSLTISSNSTAFQDPLSPTKMPNSPASSGNPYSKSWVPNSPCPPHSTHKQMVRLNEQIEP